MNLQSLDTTLSAWVQEQLSGKRGPRYASRVVQWFWETLSAKGGGLFALVVIGLSIIVDDANRVLTWLAPVVLTIAVTLVLQAVFRRPRPCKTKTTYKLFIRTYSFPSAHASTSFAFATSLSVVFLQSSLQTAWIFVVGFFVLAFLIAFSRVVVGVHYFFDIFVGALLGTTLSLLLLL